MNCLLTVRNPLNSDFINPPHEGDCSQWLRLLVLTPTSDQLVAGVSHFNPALLTCTVCRYFHFECFRVALCSFIFGCYMNSVGWELLDLTGVSWPWRECPSEMLMKDSHPLMEFIFGRCFHLDFATLARIKDLSIFLPPLAAMFFVSLHSVCHIWGRTQGSVSATYIIDKATFPHNASIFSIIHSSFLSISSLSPSLLSSSTCPPIIFSSFR